MKGLDREKEKQKQATREARRKKPLLSWTSSKGDQLGFQPANDFSITTDQWLKPLQPSKQLYTRLNFTVEHVETFSQ